MRHLTITLGALALASALVACTGGAQREPSSADAAAPADSPAASSPFGKGDSTLPIPDGDQVNPLLTNGQAVLLAFDALEKRTGKPLRVTSLTSVSGTGLTIHVQEPTHRENVDEWTVMPNGDISGPIPVHITLIGSTGRVTASDIDKEAFDPRKIPFARLNKAEHEALAKAKLQDGRLSEWTFDLQSYMISM